MATINGTSGNDTLNGTSGDDTLNGLGGNDELVGSAGNDFYDGGSGNSDTVNLRAAATPVVVDFGAGTITGGFSGSFVNIERVIASNGNDHLIGAAGAQNLSGMAGNDTLEGGAGNDWLWGGGGNDSFIFRDTGSANADQMGDFTSGTDKIELDATAMTALGASGNFASGDARFYAAAGATGGHDADDRVVYNTSTHQLFYDPDGSGSASAQLLATLDNSTALAATDIVVQGGGTSPGVINGTSGDDTLVGTPGNDTINGLGGNDSISGLEGDDSLSGGDGNDTMDGGPGTDTLDGGLGDDTYVFNDGAPGTIVDAGGVDTVIVTDNDGVLVWDLQPDIENLTLRGTSFFVVGQGNELDNVLRNEGTRASEGYLDGGDGNDTLIGGPFFLFQSGTGNYGHDFVDGAGDHGTLILGDKSAVTVDFRSGTAVGGGSGGTGTVDFVDVSSAGGGRFDDTFIADDSGVFARGNAGNDTFVGGAGNDTFSDDTQVIYDGADVGGVDSGDDSLSGGGGDDQLIVNRGSDTVDGGAGNDSLFIQIGGWFNSDGYTFNDVMDGGAGVDTLSIIQLSAVDVNLGTGAMTGGGDAGTGSATLANIENFSASEFAGFADRIVGSAASNALAGGAGADTLNGAGGTDTLTGHDGADQFLFDQVGAANADHVTDFASGTDAIHLDANVMTQLGSSGAFAAGDARFFAAPGATGGHDADDRVVYDTASGRLWYDADGNGAAASQLIATLDGAATLAATDIVVDNGSSGGGTPGEVINGTSANDTLTGTAGDDTLNGLGGNDELVGSGGNDFFDGGSGNNDTLNFRLTSTPTTVDFGAGTVSGGFIGTFVNMERVLSGDGDDHLIGTSGAQNLSGRAGNDTLEGGTGNDWLWGGGGDDTFIFREAGSANADKMGDFASGADTLAFDNATLTALGADGAFAGGDGRFFAAAGASGGHDANDRLIYNTSTGQLYYDDDGSGAHAAQLVATLEGAPSLAATDITVI